VKAAVHTKYGPPEVVRIADVPRPTASGDDILVKVYATTVNRTDCGYRAGRPFIVRLFSGLRKPRATVLGNEFAGRVESVRPTVTSFAVGDRVFGYCEGPFGAHAEYLSLPQDSAIALMPSQMAYEEAAPGTEGAHYALAFIARAKIREGQRVLVNGATGAIGSAALQLLKSLGVDVTAVCHTENVALVKRLGADRVIDYAAEDFTASQDRYDVILDAVGKSTFGRCRHLLNDRGIYLSSELGPYSQNLLLAVVTPLLRGRRVVFPLPKENAQIVAHLKELMENGEFTPVIDRRYRLDEIVAAYRYVESGRKVGNVVIPVVESGSRGRH
jgi:NADPH:quinone reductase-like Zn-dependent oxidoreductase